MQTSNHILAYIKRMMLSDGFKHTLMEISQTRRTNYVAQLFSPTQRTNWPSFFNAAVYRVHKIVKPTDQVIQTASNDIMTTLWKNKLKQPKYPVIKAESSDESEDDENADSKPKANKDGYTTATE